eukprot:16447703-Heterocapsa_arctica.AAC.1
MDFAHARNPTQQKPPEKVPQKTAPTNPRLPSVVFVGAPLGLPIVPGRLDPMGPIDRWRSGNGGLPNPHSRVWIGS